MERRKLLIASPETTVSEAAGRMADKQVGAIVIVEDGHLVGIFTERDALFRVIAKGLDPKDTRLADVMTKSPKTIGPDKSFGHAMLVMNENRFRHLPVIEDGKPIGIVSARDAMDPDLEEFVAEEHRRKQFVASR
ncbi:MAG: cyclic nucleotide-binding/CBS domain-containing protein [Gemmatimonadota bacterium]